MTDKPMTPEEAVEELLSQITHYPISPGFSPLGRQFDTPLEEMKRRWRQSVEPSYQRILAFTNQQRADARLEADIEIARLRAALEFYAKEDVYSSASNPLGFGNDIPVLVDDGVKAREALSTPSDPSPIMAVVRRALEYEAFYKANVPEIDAPQDAWNAFNIQLELRSIALLEAIEALPDWAKPERSEDVRIG